MISRLISKVRSDSPNAKIFRAGMVVSALGVLTTLATAVKELTIARYFGRSDAIDAFFLAYLLPSFVVSLVVGSLGAALIPVFVEVRQRRGTASAQELFSSVMFLSLIGLAAIALLLGVLSPYYLPYLGSGFSPVKLRMTRELLLVLLPFILFSGMAVYVASILNAMERFALPALVPLVTPAVVIIFIVVMAKQWGAFAIVGGTVAGSLVEAGALARALRVQGLRFLPRWNGLTEDVRSVLRQFSPLIAGAFLIGSAPVVDKSMAAMLPAGSVAALSYANKIVSGVLGIGATALSTAAFPYLSKMTAERDWNGCWHTLKRYSALVVVASVPLTLGLIAFSRPLVRILFQRGAFAAADTELVSKVQICYLLQIPFYIWGTLFVRFLSAAKRNEMLMYGAWISLVLDVALNLLFMRFWGVAGIALSTSALYFCGLLYLAFCSMRVLGESRVLAGARSVTADSSYR